MSERLPSEYCPTCGSERAAVRMDSGFEQVRAYQCPDCLKRWSVDGRQLPLLELEGEMRPLPFE